MGLNPERLERKIQEMRLRQEKPWRRRGENSRSHVDAMVKTLATKNAAVERCQCGKCGACRQRRYKQNLGLRTQSPHAFHFGVYAPNFTYELAWKRMLIRPHIACCPGRLG